MVIHRQAPLATGRLDCSVRMTKSITGTVMTTERARAFFFPQACRVGAPCVPEAVHNVAHWYARGAYPTARGGQFLPWKLAARFGIITLSHWELRRDTGEGAPRWVLAVNVSGEVGVLPSVGKSSVGS
jgi:hypothetical protein